MTYLFYRGQCADGKLRLSRSCFYHRSYSRSGYLGCLRLQQSPFLLGPDTNSSKLLKLLLLFLLFMRGSSFNIYLVKQILWYYRPDLQIYHTYFYVPKNYKYLVIHWLGSSMLEEIIFLWSWFLSYIRISPTTCYYSRVLIGRGNVDRNHLE